MVWRESRVFLELKKRHPTIERAEEKLGKRKRDFWDNTEASYSGSEIEHFVSGTGDLITESTRRADKEPKVRSLAVHTTLPAFIEDHAPIRDTVPTFELSLPCLSSRSWRLLDIYFTYTHSWLLIVEKNDLWGTFHQCSSDSEKIKSFPTSGQKAILWSILALADI
jgi:hypothetical protein